MSKVYPKTYPKTYAKTYGKVNPPIFIPSGGIAYYLYSWPNSTEAILEQVNRQTSTLNIGGELISGSGMEITTGDNVSVSTYTELGAFLENSGNSTVQAQFDLSSSGTTLTATGYKYDSVLTTAMIGSIVYLPDGKIATISARPTASTLTLTPVNYATLSDDTAINVGFDWSRSTQTEAAVISLRTTAGDTNVWDSAAKWPANDFEFKIKYTPDFNVASASYTYPRITSMEFTVGSEEFQIGLDKSQPSIVFCNFNDGVGSSGTPFVTMSSGNILSGDVLEITVRLTGGNLTLIVNDETPVTVATARSVVWSTCQYLGSTYDMQSYASGIYEFISVVGIL